MYIVKRHLLFFESFLLEGFYILQIVSLLTSVNILSSKAASVAFVTFYVVATPDILTTCLLGFL